LFCFGKNARPGGAGDESIVVITVIPFFLVAFAVLGSVLFAIQSEGDPTETHREGS
jgi:hypothetical protein